jgi:hypothetical protein
VPPTEKGHTPSGPNYQPSEPGGQANPPSQAKAYGWACRGESRKREKGDTEKGTPFSRCVHNMKQAHNHPNMAPGRVCKEEKVSRKREKGDTEKGTPFSRCVHNVIQLRKKERQEEKEEQQSSAQSTEATTS